MKVNIIFLVKILINLADHFAKKILVKYKVLGPLQYDNSNLKHYHNHLNNPAGGLRRW